MPELEWNKSTWDGSYDWKKAGEEWSEAWGGSDMQWFGAILPRIHHFVPARRILELAPGYGRWTRFLLGLCAQLDVVDLSQECIDACKERFRDCGHIRYWVNDGRSLDMIADASVDFCFCFDSFVHCEAEIVESYVRQLALKLSPNGVAFIHHSNLGMFPQLGKRPPLKGRKRALMQRLFGTGPLSRMGFLDDNVGCRALSMTAEKMRSIAAAHRLRCLSQELVNWGTQRPIDCFSTLVLADSTWPDEELVIRNVDFMDEAAQIRRLSSLYGAHRLTRPGKVNSATRSSTR
jgi:SAM-dependent methyltransferase